MESDSSHIALWVGILFVCVILHTLFVACAEALWVIRPSEISKGDKPSGKVEQALVWLVANSEVHLLATHFIVFFSALVAGAAGVALLRDVRVLIEQGTLASFSGVSGSALIVIGGFAALVAMFVLLQAARALGVGRARTTLLVAALPVMVVAKLLAPILFLIQRAEAAFSKLVGGSYLGLRQRPASAEELSELAERSSEAGHIEEDELEMLQGVFGFSDTLVREVMTPRKDVIAVQETASLPEIVEAFQENGLSRLLVIGEDLDEVRGIIIAKDLIPYLLAGSSGFNVEKLIRPAHYVSSTRKIDDLLKELRENAVHLAVVQDEHGGVGGVVTLEDLIEEIVGEIFDEYDSPDEEQEVVSEANGDWLIEAGMLIDDFNEAYSADLPNGAYDTIAGFVMHQLGRIPEQGETLRWNGFTLKVETVTQNRIVKVRLLHKGPVVVRKRESEPILADS